MKLPLMNKSKSSSPEKRLSSSLQAIQRKLARNALTELKIGFEIDEFRSKRDVQSLINTIKEQYLRKISMDKMSCLESIRIGWKIPRFALGPVLQQIVPLLLQPPAKVHHLQLVIDARVPLPVIERLVSWHTLESLDLRSLRIQTKAMSEPRHVVDRTPALRVDRRRFSACSSTTKSVESFDDQLQAKITADDSVLTVLPYLSPSIRTLKLVDCNLHTYQMHELIDILQKKRHVQALSLRHNRRLYMDGWEKDMLQTLPFLKSLDLSICDLDPVDGLALTAALEHPDTANSRLKSLCVAGNYRISMIVPNLVEAGARNGLIEFDCSFCDVQNKAQQQVFDCLATMEPCSLRSLKMQAMRMKNAEPLIRCIQQNASLERLILDHPREPYALSHSDVQAIKEAVEWNYFLGEVRVDVQWNQDMRVLDEIEHWLTLNRCGRSILVHDKNRHWPRVLANAASLDDIDMLYWMLRNGAEQF